MAHPYANCAPHQFWSNAISDEAPGRIDPVTRAEPIGRKTPVATIGSCFAQHIARHLAATGCHYLVAEAAPSSLSSEQAAASQYGLFSARYGNVYTVRQALQLFDRAFGSFTPVETAWPRGTAWVDPFRPRIEPQGFADVAALEADRVRHLACVRRMFTDCGWLVFTLGLTEAWRDRRDGAVFPLAPGVAGGTYSPTQHEFVNFGIDDVRADLEGLITRLHKVNPDCRLMLTVSPVPLAATFEPRHVWVSTAASKAILRAACDEVERRHPHVLYFPSYEVVTSPAAGGRYYADDLREVTEAGVRHVMRLFSRHFLESGAASVPDAAAAAQAIATAAADVICDEEAIEPSLALARADAAP